MGSNPFKAKTKTYVSAVSTNMQGNFADRGSYLVTSLLGSIISKSESPISKAFTDCYINSPGVALLSWVQNIQANNLYGLPKSTVTSYTTPPNTTVEQIIPNNGSYAKNIQISFIGVADYSWWAKQYILANYSALYSTAWTSDIDEDGIITITFADSSTTSFVPSDFEATDTYMYVMYYYSKTGEVVSVDILEDVSNSSSLPDTSGYTMESTDTNSVSVDLYTVTTETRSYSDGRPNEVTQTTDTTTVQADTTTSQYTKTEYVTDAASGTVYQEDYVIDTVYTYTVLTDTETGITEEIINEGGEDITVITTTVVDIESIAYGQDNSWTTTKTTSAVQENSNSQIIIYRFGSGVNSDIEALISSEENIDAFLPILPLRINNVSIRHPSLSAQYERAATVYRLATKSSFDSLLDKFEESDSISDIDFGAFHFGVALNNPRKECKDYIMRFLQLYGANSSSDPTEITNFLNAMDDYSQYRTEYLEWVQAVNDGTATAADKPIEPNTGTAVSMAGTEVRIRGTEAADFYDVRIAWDYLSQEVISGVSVDGSGQQLQLNDIFIDYIPVDVNVANARPNTSTGTGTYNETTTTEYGKIIFYKQVTQNSYLKLEVGNLTYKNYVYAGKYVEILGKEGLYGEEGDTTIDTSIEDSSFVFPLHYPTLRAMPLVDRAQICSEAQFITANAYKQVKQKWYQTTFFKIALIVIIIVIAYFTGYFDPATSSGVLGSSAAVGAALGFTGVAALIVGIVANSVAAIVVAALINKVAVELFGEEFGPIIGAIASIAVMQGVSSYNDTGTFAFNLADISVAQLTLYGTQIANAAMQGYAADKLAEMQAQAEQLEENYEDTIQRISDLTAEYLNPYNTSANVNGIISSFIYKRLYTDTNVDLNLLTGSDIVELSDAIVYDFVEITTQLNV